MSTIDPDARSRQRVRGPAWVQLWAALTALSGAILVGPPLVAAALSTNAVDDAASGGFAVGGLVIGCNLMPWSIMLLLRGLGRNGVLAGRGRQAGGLVVMGVGVGAAAGAAALIRQQAVGAPVSAVFLLATIVAAAAGLLVGGWLYTTAVTRAALAARVRATGVRTEGVVTHVHVTGTKVNGVPRVRFTVRFTDAQGVQRFVQGARLVSYFSGLGVGDTTTVWYDPSQPGNTHAIVVDLFT